MMTRAMMMNRYYELISEIRNLEDSSDVLTLVGRGPAGLYSSWPDGVPGRTNEIEAAILQRKDVNDAIDQLEALCGQLQKITEMLGIGLGDIA